MTAVNARGAGLALVAGHMAGMIDIASLPVWVGTLMSGYGFAPAQAGGLATLFLGGVLVSSVLLSPVFHRLPGRWIPPLGYLACALIFVAMTRLEGFGGFAVAHLLAGLCNGLALSFIHGTMARTGNPHRIFAFGNIGLGVLAVLFLAGAPALIAAEGREVLFILFAAIMALAAVITALAFPARGENEDVIADGARFRLPVWLVMVGIMCMALIQAMMMSFAERIGADRGFSLGQIQLALGVSGFIAITPSLFASLLERRLPPLGVAVAGVAAQALVALMVTRSAGYPAYMAAVILFPFVMLFAHTFVFGHLAKIEPSGRANAATPAMIMTGSASAPLLGGVLVQTSGYEALGLAAAGFALVAILAFAASRRLDRARAGVAA